MAEAMIIKGNFSQTSLSSLPVKVPLGDQPMSEQIASNGCKVVGFDLPGKRQKPSAQLTANSVTFSINNSITKKDRVNAIFTACSTFNHGIEAVHDEEVKAGADIALCKHLSLLLLQRNRMRTSIAKQNINDKHEQEKSNYEEGDQKRKHSLSVDLSPHAESDVEGIEKEINDTVSGVEMVLRCSADSVSVSYTRAGSELLPLLLDMISEETLKIKEDNQTFQEHPSAISIMTLPNDKSKDVLKHDSSSTVSTLVPESVDRKHEKLRELTDSRLKVCTKIVGHFARVGSLTEAMAHTPSFLNTLQNVISLPFTTTAPIEAILNSLWILANLACSADNMLLMARHPDLINILVRVASHPTKEEESSIESISQYMEMIRSRSIAVRAILNLSWAHENKVPFSSNLALLDALLETVSHRTSPWAGNGKGVSGILLQSRRHAAGALRNLGAAPRRYKRSLCRLRSGTFLDIMAEIASNDPDSVVRDKIHATLYNVVSADTAKLFTEKQYVIDVISNAAMNEDEDDRTGLEDGSDSYTMASRTLRTLEKSIPEDEEGYNVLRPHLMKRFDSIANSMTNIGHCTSSEAV